MQGSARSEPPAAKFEFDEAYVKSFFGGFFCVCLFFLSTAPARAQEPPAQEPAQNPPPRPPGPTTRQPPPLPPRPPDQSMPDEGKFSVGITGWVPTGKPTMDAGPIFGTDALGNTVRIPAAVPSRVQFQGKPKVVPGAELNFAAGKHHALRISFFRANASGNLTAPTDLLLWNGTYTKGDYLSTNYRLQNVKISYEFLTWPYPIATRRFRLKTLWQFQYTNMKTAFDAPLKSTANGSNATTGSKNLYAPTFGLSPAYYVSRNFRLEANASGFAIPHRWTIWDTDASASYRIGKVEVRVGAKAFHFRTSPKADYYLRGTLAGAFVGLRYFLN